MPPAIRSRAVADRPSVSRSRTVTTRPPPESADGVPSRPAARGLPKGLNALSVTLGASSTDSAPVGSGLAGRPRRPVTTATRSWLYSSAAALNPAWRQPPAAPDDARA